MERPRSCFRGDDGRLRHRAQPMANRAEKGLIRAALSLVPTTNDIGARHTLHSPRPLAGGLFMAHLLALCCRLAAGDFAELGIIACGHASDVAPKVVMFFRRRPQG